MAFDGILRQSTAVDVLIGPFVDATDGVTPETGLTIQVDVSKNGQALADRSDVTNPTHDAAGTVDGYYNCELDATDTNTVGNLVLACFASGALQVRHSYQVVETAIYDAIYADGATGLLPANVTQWLGSAAATPTVAGVPEVDVTHWIGTAAATPTVAGVPEVDITHVAGATTDVSALATNVAAILVDTGTTLDGRIPAALVSGRIDASVGAMAANVITAAATAADFSTEVRSLVSGTSDSGSTTTMVDAARTEADTDYWKGALIVFTSGTIAGQARVITAFDAATDTMTFSPATTQTVGTQTYEIWPVGDFLRPTTSGRTLDVSAGGEGGVDWANVGSPTTAVNLSATNIDVDQVVASVSGAVGSVTGLTAATVHSDLDDIQSKIGTPAGASLSADVAAIEAQTDDIGVAGAGLTAIPWNAAWDAEVESEVDDALGGGTGTALTAIPWNASWDAEVESEVNDAIDTAIAELGVAAPTATPTLRTALMLMYMALRNKLVVQTSGTDAIEIYNNAGTKIAAKTITDDGADYTEDEMA